MHYGGSITEAEKLIQNTVAEKYGSYGMKLSLKLGCFTTNGYLANRTKECVADGFLKAGICYDFPEAPYGYQYTVVYYNSDTSGTTHFAWGTGARRRHYLEQDAKISFRRTNGTNDLTQANIEFIRNNFIIKECYSLGMNKTYERDYVPGISTNVLRELYIPLSSGTGWTLRSVITTSTSYRFAITLYDGTVVINGADDVGTSYSDTVLTLVNPNTGNIVGYFVLHYPGYDYSVSMVSYTPDTILTRRDRKSVV